MLVFLVVVKFNRDRVVVIGHTTALEEPTALLGWLEVVRLDELDLLVAMLELVIDELGRLDDVAGCDEGEELLVLLEVVVMIELLVLLELLILETPFPHRSPLTTGISAAPFDLIPLKPTVTDWPEEILPFQFKLSTL